MIPLTMDTDYFQSIFPNIDRQVIETVLHENNGIRQLTMEHLLVLQKEDTNGDGKDCKASLDDIALTLDPKELDDNRPSQLAANRFWKAPLVGQLADDFLRIPNYAISSKNTADCPFLSTPINAVLSRDREVENIRRESEKLSSLKKNLKLVQEIRQCKKADLESASEQDREAILRQKFKSTKNWPFPTRQ